jgi:hypothetical protein
MSKTFVRQIKLRRWFPPDDRFAACVARLCILREDLFLEMAGIHSRSISPLDSNSVAWRQKYFWRHLVKTIGEIRQTFEMLNAIPEFRSAFKGQPPIWKAKFDRIVRKLSEERLLVKRLRDALGGHVLQQTVAEALNKVSTEAFSYIEVAALAKKTHYRFANDLVRQMMLADAPETMWEGELRRGYRTTAELLPVFEVTDIIFTVYANSRNLLD